MRIHSGICYSLWSDQIVKLRERLDETRWMAIIWDRAAGNWSPSVYAIDERLINAIVRDPQSLGEHCIG